MVDNLLEDEEDSTRDEALDEAEILREEEASTEGWRLDEAAAEDPEMTGGATDEDASSELIIEDATLYKDAEAEGTIDGTRLDLCLVETDKEEEAEAEAEEANC